MVTKDKVVKTNLGKVSRLIDTAEYANNPDTAICSGVKSYLNTSQEAMLKILRKTFARNALELTRSHAIINPTFDIGSLSASKP